VHPLTGASDMHLRLCLLGANDRPSSSPHKHRREIVLLGTSPHLLLPEVARSLETLHGDPQPDINHSDSREEAEDILNGTTLSWCMHAPSRRHAEPWSRFLSYPRTFFIDVEFSLSRVCEVD
jgi:hypothetical protein